MTGHPRVPERGTSAPQTPTEQGNVRAVCRHLALVAIDGATDEVAESLAAGFRLHVNGAETDHWGYLALIEANHAAHGTRPPLDLISAYGIRDFVTARLEPRCLAHFRVVGGHIAEIWMTTDWQSWCDRIVRGND